MRRSLLALPFLLAPLPAFAHSAEGGIILLLPTGYYLAGGAAAVAVSFLILALAPHGWSAPGRWRRSFSAPPLPRAALNWAGFAAFWALVAIGFAGVRDPLENLLPLTVWTAWWVGFTVAVAIFGDLWRVLNPWSAPLRLVRRLTGPPVLRYPGWLGYWPAIVGFLGVSWFEIVSLAPDDPAVLARAVTGYWLMQFALMLVFGEAAWRRRGETFSVLFRLLGRLSPLQPRRLTLPGAAVAGAGTLGRAGWLFVTAAIAGVTFDGLAGTFWWLSLIGVNPLEFPGRSAVMVENTAGLIAVWLAMSAAFGGAVLLGWKVAGRGADLRRCLGRLTLSLLPIALAYHFAHFLTILLVNGQYWIAALSDPLGTGLDWMGLGPHWVHTGFLADHDDVELIWQVQAAAITGGHLLAVALAHAIALDLWPDARRAVLSQIPLAALMVGYTLLGLWLLATPAGV